jgi:hypothetical protein
LQLSFFCFVFPFTSHSFLYVYLFILRRRTKPTGTVEPANYCPVLISQLGSSAGHNSCKIHDYNRSGSFGLEDRQNTRTFGNVNEKFYRKVFGCRTD